MSIMDRFNNRRWLAKSKKTEPQSKFVKEKKSDKNFRRRKMEVCIFLFVFCLFSFCFFCFFFSFTLACFRQDE